MLLLLFDVKEKIHNAPHSCYTTSARSLSFSFSLFLSLCLSVSFSLSLSLYLFSTRSCSLFKPHNIFLLSSTYEFLFLQHCDINNNIAAVDTFHTHVPSTHRKTYDQTLMNIVRTLQQIKLTYCRHKVIF